MKLEIFQTLTSVRMTLTCADMDIVLILMAPIDVCVLLATSWTGQGLLVLVGNHAIRFFIYYQYEEFSGPIVIKK